MKPEMPPQKQVEFAINTMATVLLASNHDYIEANIKHQQTGIKMKLRLEYDHDKPTSDNGKMPSLRTL